MTELKNLSKDLIKNHTGFNNQISRTGRMVKKEEMNDIIQYLIPALGKIDILKEYCKIDVTTEKSGASRGDVWISSNKQNAGKKFEEGIIALIEAKHKKTNVGDMDWRDAMRQGREKAKKQNLNFYVVSNCKTEHRFYNSHNDEEIYIDGNAVTNLVTCQVLISMQAQISNNNSQVTYKSKRIMRPVSTSKFRTTLKNLADIYRSAGLKKGDERIDPTISFVVLKYISEKESERRTLNNAIKLWDDLRNIAHESENGDMRIEFKSMVAMIWNETTYSDNVYQDFKNLIDFPDKLKNQHYKKAYLELEQYHFHGADFDLFGAIYEEFASQTKKKEFGEFYTRRHITGMIAKLLLRKETNPRKLKICDPACGSGGFLTEAFAALYRNYSVGDVLNDDVLLSLKQTTLWGFDNEEKSVARTKLNMFLAGDGHVHIYENDSLRGWDESKMYAEQEFDYILTNPPMGKYDGEVQLEEFDFVSERRYEMLFVEKIIKTTKNGGHIAVIVNDGMLESPTRGNFRKKILENCTVHAVISLTKFAFAPYTKEKTYVMFMQKKQNEDVGAIQKTPIWNFIIDYDGYANSDKRFKTKYHDDVPELESKFNNSLDLARKPDMEFEAKRHEFERPVNDREKNEGRTGYKYGFVTMNKISNNNFYNLLSEFHLRPYTAHKIFEDALEEKLMVLETKLQSIMTGA